MPCKRVICEIVPAVAIAIALPLLLLSRILWEDHINLRDLVSEGTGDGGLQRMSDIQQGAATNES